MSVYCRSTVSKLLVYCRLTVGRLLLGEHACAIEFDLMSTCILDVIKIIIQRTVLIFHVLLRTAWTTATRNVC